MEIKELIRKQNRLEFLQDELLGLEILAVNLRTERPDNYEIQAKIIQDDINAVEKEIETLGDADIELEKALAELEQALKMEEGPEREYLLNWQKADNLLVSDLEILESLIAFHEALEALFEKALQRVENLEIINANVEEYLKLLRDMEKYSFSSLPRKLTGEQDKDWDSLIILYDLKDAISEQIFSLNRQRAELTDLKRDYLLEQANKLY